MSIFRSNKNQSKQSGLVSEIVLLCSSVAVMVAFLIVVAAALASAAAMQ
jgi:hypothetical protein